MPLRALLRLCLGLAPLAAATTLPAQRAAPSAVPRLASSAAPVRAARAALQPSADTSSGAASGRGREWGARSFLGLLGGVGGLFAGGFVGATVIPHHDCHCDDPGLAEAVMGAAVGSVVGAAMAASAPVLASRCSWGKRLGVSLLTSAGGTAVGALLGGAIADGGGVAVGWFGGAAAGAGTGATLCGGGRGG